MPIYLTSDNMLKIEWINQTIVGEFKASMLLNPLDYPRGVPYDVCVNGFGVKLIPWKDLVTRRFELELIKHKWYTPDGWELIGVFSRGPVDKGGAFMWNYKRYNYALFSKYRYPTIE